MTTTMHKDLYSPEVWEDAAQASFKTKSVLVNAATQNDNLVGKPGDTIEFPKWGTLSEMADLTEGDAMVTEKMDQSSSKATIKEAGKAVEISDKANLTGTGNAQDEAIRQFGILAARKLDTDLYSAAIATVVGGLEYADGSTSVDSKPLSFNAGAAVSFGWSPLVDGLGLFGDDFEPEEFEGLYINSADRALALKDPNFIAASQGPGSNGVITRGLIGDIAGLPVIVTDRIAAGKSMVVKTGALGVMWKRRPLVEMDRDILKRTNVVATNLHYAVKRLNDSGILVVNWKTA